MATRPRVAITARGTRLDPAESTAKPQRPIAPWELDARLDEAPIGTVEYIAKEDGSATLTLPEERQNPPKRGNPRMARIAEARKGR